MSEFDTDNPLDFDISTQQVDKSLQITEEIIQYWRQTANLLMVLSMVFFAFVLILILSYQTAMSTFFGVSGIGTFLIMLFCILALIPGILYWRAGNTLKLGCERSETETVERGFESLMYVLGYSGILIALYFLLIILFIFAALIFGLTSRF